MIRHLTLAVCVVLLAWPLAPPRLAAEIQDLPLDVCNRSSFAADIAIGLEVSSGAATQGWFRVLPGQCREILKQGLGANRHLLHVRPLKLYGAPPTAEPGARRLCVRDADFLIAGASECARSGQYMAEFVVVEPIIVNERRQIAVDEKAGFDSSDARTAGLQRLLGVAGYDVGLVDGVSGTRTQAAIRTFADEAGLDADDDIALMTALVERIESGRTEKPPQFCNETLNRLMLAVGVPVGDTVETRGWFPIPAGECARPVPTALAGTTLYAFAEAVDRAGAPLLSDGQPLAWRGDRMLCTKNLEFRIRDHAACEKRGLTTHGFRPYVVPDEGGLVVPFDDRPDGQDRP